MADTKNASPLKRFLNTREAAVYLGLAANTLRWYRYINQGPVYSKPRGRCVYDVADLDKFVASGVRVPSSSARASKESERVAL